MKSKVTVAALVILGLVGAWLSVGQAQAEEAKKFGYVGAKTCKMCHNKAEDGAQFDVWAASPHAKAYESLASPESKAKAKEMGIDDPQKSEKCLSCHVTAFSVMANLANEKITLEEGVSCESCHGPGSEYKSKKVKDAIVAGEIKAESVGLMKGGGADFCVTCHKAEGNPFHKEFKYEEYLKKIAHPKPAK